MPVRDVPAPIDNPSAKAGSGTRSRIRGWCRLMHVLQRKTQANLNSPALLHHPTTRNRGVPAALPGSRVPSLTRRICSRAAASAGKSHGAAQLNP